MTILFCTLGNTWEIPFEALALTCYDSEIDLYKKSPEYYKISQIRVKHVNQIANQIIIFSTDQEHIFQNFKELIISIEKYLNYKSKKIDKIDIFVLDGVSDISSNDEVIHFDNMILSVISKFKIENPESQIFLSIAGGRKTMSSSLHNAGFTLGADCVFHIIELRDKIGNLVNKYNDEKKKDDFNIIDKLNFVLPVFVGKYPDNDIFTEELQEDFRSEIYQYFNRFKKLDTKIFQKNLKNQIKNRLKIEFNIYKVPKEITIRNFIFNQLEKATFYYMNSIDSTEDIFKTLFKLRKETIQKLKEYKLGVNKDKKEDELKLLMMLPKTDLHCHLGGVLDCKDLINLSNLIQQEIEKEIDNNKDIPKNLDQFKILIKNYGGLKNLNIANIKKSTLILYFISLFENDVKGLENFIFNEYQDEENFRNIGIVNYERLGDIQGSSLLQNIKTIKYAVKCCIEKAIDENVKHLELRCSPINYTKEGLSEQKVIKAILEQMDVYNDKISLVLIIIASRHKKMSEIYRIIELISDIYESQDKYLQKLFCKFFKGIDLAGDESKGNFEEIRMAFLRAMNFNLNITIHAGETSDVSSIYKAIYYLNAERIGHGLKLIEDNSLLNKIRERKIAIELCPSSNFQICNFKDNYYKNKYNTNGFNNEQLKEYPLKYYLDNGLRITINTDNPGISRTNITNELLKASRLTNDGLSLWDILKILKMGFKSYFLDFETKKELYLKAEKDIDNFIEYFINQKRAL